jgi:hypothetical protein
MTTNEITIAPEIKTDPELLHLIEKANPVLRNEMGESPANAVWELKVDPKSRKLLVLKLHDKFDGGAVNEFAPDELDERYEDHLRLRFHDLKGAMIRVGEWRRQLRELFDAISNWAIAMKPPLLVENREVLVSERRSGPYEAPALTLRRGNDEIRVEPIAIWIVGAEGRVDFHGPLGSSIVVREAGRWHVVSHDYRRRQVPLDFQEFARIVEELGL